MPPTVTFDENATEFILECFEKDVDTDGYIVEADTKERVVTPEGREIKAEDLAITAEGSELFIEDNFASIVDYVERKHEKE